MRTACFDPSRFDQVGSCGRKVWNPFADRCAMMRSPVSLKRKKREPFFTVKQLPHRSDFPAVGLRLADGDVRAIGRGSVAATIVINSTRGLTALASMDATFVIERLRAAGGMGVTA